MSERAQSFPYKVTIEVSFRDLDAMGHVNNTIYVRYFEIIRIEWLHQVVGAPDAAGEGPVIVNTFCNFLRQLKYPGDVLYASGGAKTVWVNYRREKSVPLPEAVRALIA